MESEFYDIDERFVKETLKKLTGFDYVFAAARGRLYQGVEEREGIYYQLMPKTSDDGFFEWYCRQDEEAQFYHSKSECALKFIDSYLNWEKLRNK